MASWVDKYVPKASSSGGISGVGGTSGWSMGSAGETGVARAATDTLARTTSSNAREVAQDQAIADYINSLTNAYANSGGGYTPQVNPQYVDVNAINAQARGLATANISPFYQTEAANYLTRFNLEKTRAQRDADIARTQEEEDFKTYNDAIAKQMERSKEDADFDINDVLAQVGYYQREQGAGFDTERSQLLNNIGAGNLTTSGLGRQRVTGAEKSRNLAEREVMRQTDAKQVAVKETLGRRVDDLFSSKKQRGVENARTLQGVTLTLDDLIKDLDDQRIADERSLEQQKLGALGTEESKQRQLIFNQILAGITDPAVRQATEATYRGSMA